MGLFNKITDATKKMTQVVESKVSQVVDTSTEKVKELTANVEKPTTQTPQQPPYIPDFVCLEQSIPENINADNNELESMEKIVGNDRTFSLDGKVLNIPASLDAFNSYRKMFRELAIRYSEKVQAEYTAKVYDYITFVEEFPRMYDANLYPIVQRALDVLVSENIWNITFETMVLAHKEHFHLAIDSYYAMKEATELTINANKQVSAGVVSIASDFLGSQLGKFGASSFFEGLKEGLVQGSIEGVGVSPAQQSELYQRIDSDKLFRQVYVDYCNVFLTLVAILKTRGNDIWMLDSSNIEEASNIFKNLSNPNFPKDKVVEVLFDILDTNPYDVNYYKFLVTKFGETEEVTAIREYFGYTDFDDLRMC